MKKFFLQNKVLVGIVAEVLSLIIPALLLYAGLSVFSLQVEGHERWFAGVFIVGILVVRAYAKAKEFPKATKASAIVFFVTFVLFMAYLFKNKIL